jgi:HPt (histidine-containing phosphotransfer) domain-containing protein
MVPLVQPESAVLDLSVMTAIRSLGAPGDPDVYQEVAVLFLADVPIRLAELGAAFAAGSAASVAEIAHHLRGGALEIGALRIAPLCAAIEQSARSGFLTEAAAQAESLDRECAAARVALEQAIAG